MTPKEEKDAEIKEAFRDRYDEYSPNEQGLLANDEIIGDGLWLLNGGYEKVWIDNKLYWKKL